MAKHRIRDIWFLSHSQCQGEAGLAPPISIPALDHFAVLWSHSHSPPSSPTQSSVWGKGFIVKSGPGKCARSRESTPGQGKSKPEGVFQLPAWQGLIPFSPTPRAVVRNTPQDCLPEKWKGECFFTSSVPGWLRVPKRLKSVPLTSASCQGSPQREALSGTPWLSGCHGTDWYCLMQSLPLSRNLPVLSMLCAQPNARPFLCISLFTPGHTWLGRYWCCSHFTSVETEVLSGEMTRSWCVALQGQGLLGPLFPAPALTFTGGCSAGQTAPQAMAAFHGLSRPQLRAWFLFGEPSQKSSQGPDGVL